jgi:hypothetical protein
VRIVKWIFDEHKSKQKENSVTSSNSLLPWMHTWATGLVS